MDIMEKIKKRRQVAVEKKIIFSTCLLAYVCNIRISCLIFQEGPSRLNCFIVIATYRFTRTVPDKHLEFIVDITLATSSIFNRYFATNLDVSNYASFVQLKLLSFQQC